MFEYNGSEFHSQNDRDMAEIADLQGKLHHLQASHDNYKQLYLDASNTIREAKSIIEEALKEAEDPMALYAEFREAFENLGVEVTEEVEVTITATWTVTVTKPMGYELDGNNDFTAELDTANGDLDVDRIWRTPDITVEETGY